MTKFEELAEQYMVGRVLFSDIKFSAYGLRLQRSRTSWDVSHAIDDHASTGGSFEMVCKALGAAFESILEPIEGDDATNVH